ncbi:short-chain dehydrogenase [Brasilonema octagenarum UFV-E1]|uniref:Short-chain dehydrogenase n=1 Tax=Brasilonema sennae CENA114 TaxID=415709 RepID=A0A856MG46_9CYAN|nr:glucose 1-dehydrogenase [Brasilonema sennae]QDL09622.1 short-chain dehydrogenase [Brasilonema sennae CENA114]QDL15978.1 short-chain dehydrogenase [Brasilonema octagenarum UFV-E1]
MNRVQDKVAIVTGAARGIGGATALLLAKEGAKVAVTDILADEGKTLVQEIHSHGSEADYWHLDVSQETQVKQVFAEVYRKWGKIDILVNNAGIAGINKPTHEISEEEWNTVMAINTNGVFLCTKHAIAYMLNTGGGSIINLSSIAGLVGSRGYPPYHAAKGAVRLMTKANAIQYAKNNIRFNSIHPGLIWTAIVEEPLKKTENPTEVLKDYEKRIPAGRLGKPDDIAYGILYLASDESKYMTGAELVIDGGYTAQ